MTVCPSCAQRIRPEVPVGTEYPDTGYGITLEHFRQLLDNGVARPVMSALLDRWYGYEIGSDAGLPTVQTRAGDRVDIMELHREIQGDPTRQRELYGVAMSLWR
jgi:hypothetical protein